jgi:hypothetical protein
MNIKLIEAALRGQNVAEFTNEDVNNGAVKELYAAAGLPENASTRDFIAKKDVVFSIVAEAVDEILPKDITNIMGAFAEVKTYARDAEVVFQMKTGARRARLSIQKGARGGVYKAARLDNKLLSLDVDTWTVGVFVTLEDILLGRITLAELYNNILAGYEEKVFEETVAALRTASTYAPESHTMTVAEGAGTLLSDRLDQAIRIAKAYGDNVAIFAFQSEAAKIANPTAYIGDADKNDVRTKGYVTLYKGTPVVEIPNYILADGATVTWAFKENQLFVLPGDAKPVKIAFKGDSYIEDVKMPGGAEQWNSHKLAGVGLLLADNVCIVNDGTSTDGQY